MKNNVAVVVVGLLSFAALILFIYGVCKLAGLEDSLLLNVRDMKR
jgi:hypothetical protein